MGGSPAEEASFLWLPLERLPLNSYTPETLPRQYLEFFFYVMSCVYILSPQIEESSFKAGTVSYISL